MTNIFSGLFNQNSGGGAAVKLAKYKQEIEDYQDKKDAWEQKQAMAAIRQQLGIVSETMDPQRQKMMTLSEIMSGNTATFDKGMEMLIDQTGAKSGSIADRIKQERTLDRAKKTRDYYIANPIPGEGSAKLQYAVAYAGGQEKFDALSDKERKIIMDRAARARQLVDMGTYNMDIATGVKYDKNTGEVIIESKAAEHIVGRLTGYADNLVKRENQMIGMDEYITQLELLDSGADWTTTGMMQAALGWIPGMDQRDWRNTLDTVNAKSVMEAMTTLKAMSSTGSTGFGAVNLKELETMQDNWGKLDPLSSPEQIKSVVQDRLRILKKLQANVRRSMADDAQWYKNNRAKLPARYRDAFDSPDESTVPPPEVIEQTPTQTAPAAVGRWNPETQKIEMY